MEERRDKGLVLIVDDNAANRHLLKAIVERSHYRSAQCENGQECVEYCLREKPTIVLLDVMMPVMDGIEACKILREKYGKEELPIIMVTTKVSGADVALGFSAGASDYVTKPVDRNVLLTRIENQLRVFHYQQSLAVATKAMEQALGLQQALGDAMPQAIFVHDRFGTALYQNQLAEILSGGQKASTVVELFRMIFDATLVDEFPEARLAEILSGVQDIDEEARIHIDDQDRYLSISSRPIVMEGQDPFRYWVFREVTKERVLEQKMNQQVKMETVGLFASGVAHNFNNIFGSILGAVDILKRSANNPERFQRCLQICDNAIASGIELTKKMYTAKAQLKKDGSTGFSLLGSAMKLAWVEVVQQFPDKRIDFTLDSQLSSLRVFIPSAGVQGIFTGLFENAVDAIDQRGSVRCWLENIDTDKGVATIGISDSGCGMDEAMLTHACEPFFSTKKMDHTNNVSVEGKGLGLWNVYNIIRLAGGDLRFESVLGSGTTVWLDLPLIAKVRGGTTKVREIELNSSPETPQPSVEDRRNQ